MCIRDRYSRGCSRAFGTRTWHELPYNLIPVNPIKERDYLQSNKGFIEAFKNMLEKNGINVTIRREMGLSLIHI